MRLQRQISLGSKWQNVNWRFANKHVTVNVMIMRGASGDEEEEEEEGGEEEEDDSRRRRSNLTAKFFRHHNTKFSLSTAFTINLETFGCIHHEIHRSALSMCRSQQEIGQLIFLLSCNMKRSVADRRRSPGMWRSMLSSCHYYVHQACTNLLKH